MEEIKVYTMEEVAEILSVTVRTAYNYVRDGQLRAVKIGRVWRVRAEDLRAFLERGATVSDGNRRPENQAKNRKKASNPDTKESPPDTTEPKPQEIPPNIPPRMRRTMEYTKALMGRYGQLP